VNVDAHMPERKLALDRLANTESSGLRFVVAAFRRQVRIRLVAPGHAAPHDPLHPVTEARPLLSPRHCAVGSAFSIERARAMVSATMLPSSEKRTA
jgi:hypothetical protein